MLNASPVGLSRGYRHRLHLVAEALVAVGRGVSYTRAAQRARAAAGWDPLTGESAGQMVAEWVDAWAPAVLDALAETEQPESLVLDSTDFWWTNSSTRTRRREFAILVAHGYTGPKQGRVWGIHASPTARAVDCEQLLRNLRLPGPPASIAAAAPLDVRCRSHCAAPAQPVRAALVLAPQRRADEPAARAHPAPPEQPRRQPYPRILRQAAEARLGQPRSNQRLNRDPRAANGAPQPSLR